MPGAPDTLMTVGGEHWLSWGVSVNRKGQSLCLQLEILVLGELLESVQLLSS